MALAALRGVHAPRSRPCRSSVARRFLAECRSADALNWLRLGLLAHGRTAGRATAARRSGVPHRCRRRRSTMLVARSAGAGATFFWGMTMTPKTYQARMAGGVGWRAARRCSRPAAGNGRMRSLARSRSCARPPTTSASTTPCGAFSTSTGWTCAAASGAQAQPGGVRARQQHQHPSPAGARRLGGVPRLGAASVRIAEGPGPPPQHAGPGRRRRLLPDRPAVRRPLRRSEPGRCHARAPRRASSRASTSCTCPTRRCGADLLVSMPKMKTHHWVGATLSMKNLFGAGARRRLRLAQERAALGRHRRVHRRPARRLSRASSPSSTASSGMEGNGPIQGVPKHAGVLVAGSDPVAVDATCCRIMRIDPFQHRLPAAGHRAARCARSPRQNIRQIGEAIAARGHAVRTDSRISVHSVGE